MRRLSDIASITIGRTPPRAVPSYWTSSTERPFCTIADMTSWDINPQREGVTAAAVEAGKARLVPAGSLLLSFKLTIGKVGFAQRDLYPNEAIAWVAPKSTVHERYLAHFLSLSDLTRGAGRAVKGDTLNSTSLAEIEVYLPPLDEQQRLAAALDNVMRYSDAAKAYAASSWTALHATREDLLAAGQTGSALLADIADIGANLVDPTDAGTRDLPHIGVDRIESRTGRVLPCQTAAEDGVTSGKFFFDTGDVVYSKIRPELRKAALPDFAGLCSADAYPLRCGERVLPEFLLEVLLSDGFVSEAVARSGRTKMPKINREELFAIEVPLPSIDRQRSVAGLLGLLRKQAVRAEQVADAADQLRKAVFAEQVTGMAAAA